MILKIIYQIGINLNLIKVNNFRQNIILINKIPFKIIKII